MPETTTPAPPPPPATPGPGSVKLSAKLPKVDPLNGLGTIHGQLTGFGSGYVIMQVSSHEHTRQLTGARVPVAVIERIEGLPAGPLEAAAKDLMRHAREARERNDGVIPGMERDTLADDAGSDTGDTGDTGDAGEYVEGIGNGAGWND